MSIEASNTELQRRNHIRKLLEELTRMLKAGLGTRQRRSTGTLELEHFMILLTHPVSRDVYQQILHVLMDVKHAIIKGMPQEKLLHEIEKEIEFELRML